MNGLDIFWPRLVLLQAQYRDPSRRLGTSALEDIKKLNSFLSGRTLWHSPITSQIRSSSRCSWRNFAKIPQTDEHLHLLQPEHQREGWNLLEHNHWSRSLDDLGSVSSHHHPGCNVRFAKNQKRRQCKIWIRSVWLKVPYLVFFFNWFYNRLSWPFGMSQADHFGHFCSQNGISPIELDTRGNMYRLFLIRSRVNLRLGSQ